MLNLPCPVCQIWAEETEFSYGGAAHMRREIQGSSDAAFEAYLFLRDNPKGPHLERWCHSAGCGKWFNLARCTASLQVFGAYLATEAAPPPKLVRKIRAQYPQWSPSKTQGGAK